MHYVTLFIRRERAESGRPAGAASAPTSSRASSPPAPSVPALRWRIKAGAHGSGPACGVRRPDFDLSRHLDAATLPETRRGLTPSSKPFPGDRWTAPADTLAHHPWPVACRTGARTWFQIDHAFIDGVAAMNVLPVLLAETVGPPRQPARDTCPALGPGSRIGLLLITHDPGDLELLAADYRMFGSCPCDWLPVVVQPEPVGGRQHKRPSPARARCHPVAPERWLVRDRRVWPGPSPRRCDAEVSQ